MDLETKAKLANKLTRALHQAPEHPETFVNIVRQVIGTAGLHITDLAIVFGDLTNRMAEQLRAARNDAQPTYENLVDLAQTKINLGRKPEKALSTAIGVSVAMVEECRRRGRVPRAWFQKVQALPDLDETRQQLDAETTRVARLLAEKGYSVEQIYAAFQHVRANRAGMKQIANAVHGQDGQMDVDELRRMQGQLFGDKPDARRRFQIWVGTHLRFLPEQPTDNLARILNTTQVERLRARFKREVQLRDSDVAYKRVAQAAELIVRPLRASSRAGHVDRMAESRELRVRLERIFADAIEERAGDQPERLNKRLSQLTGLDERHTLDLLNGANGVGDAWWRFLDAVEIATNNDLPLLRQMGGIPVEPRF
jgi:hypothetical protein